jgi:hypothetical protein
VTDGDRSPAPGPRVDEPDRIVLHSSWSGIAFSVGGTSLLVALAIFAVASVGFTVVSVVLIVVALLAAAVVVFDMPIASEFDRDGVTRRALARRDRLSWDGVDRLSRMRTGWFRSSKMAPTGGLIAVRGRRNVTLVDRMEGHVEYRHLRSVLGDQGERLGIERIAEPPIGQAPTWMHRSARWAPDQPGDR